MEELPAIMEIYDEARAFMRENGNPEQWRDGYPDRGLVAGDIRAGACHVCVQGGAIAAVFYFNVERDPTYARIDGAWIGGEPCGVVHRIARRRGAKGAGAHCISWCYAMSGNVKIDTHQDNAPMLAVLGRLGFERCGTIWLENGEARIAFQKC